MKRYLIVLLIAPTLALANSAKPPVPSPAAQDCRARSEAKEYEKALDVCTQAAKAGDLESQHLLGRMYEKANGVPRDLDVALRWYRSAADKGHAASQRRVAAAYAFGVGGVKKDEVEALKWLKLAAESGDTRAQKQLAEGYRRGAGGLPKDEKLAREWLDKAEKNKK